MCGYLMAMRRGLAYMITMKDKVVWCGLVVTLCKATVAAGGDYQREGQV